MEVQINTDDHIDGREALSRWIETEVDRVLGRFADHLTRVEIHLSDENASKSGPTDKRCLVEVRPAGRQPLAVSNESATLEDAFAGAAKKMQRLLDTTFGRASHRKGSESIRTDDLEE